MVGCSLSVFRRLCFFDPNKRLSIGQGILTSRPWTIASMNGTL